MTKLIAITGADGTGKSTVCALLSKSLSRKSIIVTIWDILRETPFYPCKTCLYCYLQKINPTARSLLIFHGLAQALHNALEQKADYVLLDGYWYKYAVSEQAMSGKENQFAIAHHAFPIPHNVFYLHAQAQVTLQRKSFLSSYECGFCEGNSDDNFLSFQHSVDYYWQELLQLNPSWQHISTHNKNALDVAEMIRKKICYLDTHDNNQIHC